MQSFSDWPNKNAFVSKDVNILQKIELFNLGDIIKAFTRRCLWQSGAIVPVNTSVVNDHNLSLNRHLDVDARNLVLLVLILNNFCNLTWIGERRYGSYRL